MNKILLFIAIFGFICIFYVEQVNSLSVNDNNVTNNTQDKIHLRLDWNDNEIVNGKEFNIKVSAFNLGDKSYDLKVYLYEDDKNSPISQTRDEDFKWISSNLYVKNFFMGPGDQSESIKLRINDNYNTLGGGATIIARIRETGTSSYVEEQEDIFIIKTKIINETKNDNMEQNQVNQLNNEINPGTNMAENVIRIQGNKQTESIKSQNNMVYESKNELIKRYSIYGFIILIIIFLILLAFRFI